MFASRGHPRVACFVSHRFKFAEAYEVGLREVIRESGGDLPEGFVHYGSYSGGPVTQAFEDEMESALDAMLRASDPPTGLFCTWDLDAEITYFILQRMGLRVGIDVSLCSFGGAVRETAIARRLTAVTVDELALGRKAAEILDEIGRGVRPLDDAEVVTLPVGVFEGETLGDAPGRMSSALAARAAAATRLAP
jgi:DNA-binding LacI/PurR family transcriptional regulator